jgi:hypothetical protein
VRGKDLWRLTSASKTNMFEGLVKKPETFIVFGNIAHLLKRLLAGEDANEELFADILSGLSILEKAETTEELRNIEMILVLRILNNLGYIGGGEDLRSLVKSPFEKELIFEAITNRNKILSEINKALRETHL